MQQIARSGRGLESVVEDMGKMTRYRWIGGAVGVVLVLVLSAFAYDRVQSDRIASGVRIGGIDVSGLSRGDAEVKLAREIALAVKQPVVVTYRGKRRTLKPEKSKVRVDVPGMVDRAVRRSHEGFFVVNTARSIAGRERGIAIPVEITYSDPAVRRFVRSVGKSFNVAPRDASLDYTRTRISVKPAERGKTVRYAALKRAIVERLENPTEPRRLRAPMRNLNAKVRTRSQLARKYPTVLIVDRSGFKLRLYKNLKLARTYPIAVGKVGMDTPAGLYTINNRAENPAWHVPNSDWAGDLAGTVVPPGPDNPIVARWLGIYDGVGIHGTNDISSLGTAASHGCIRMKPSDVIALYPQIPVGTPIYIA